MTVEQKHVVWPRAIRIIRSIYPPIDLFEDLADPEDWEAIAAGESKSNPRLQESIGDLGKVPPDRRVAGPGASYVMAPFVHCSTDRPGRFTDGSFGIYYAGNSTPVAIAETVHHHAKFMLTTDEEPSWTSQFRELVGSVDSVLDDASNYPEYLDPDDYKPSQVFGAQRREAGSNGIFWPSVRHPGGECIGIFWPDVVTILVQGDHFAYHWNGTVVDYVKNVATGEIWSIVD